MKSIAPSLIDFSGRATVPVLLQTEAAECGLACLAIIASYHGYRTDVATLRKRHSISLKGTTLPHLIAMAAQMHLGARALKVDMEHLDEIALPAVLHWDFNHFVVLTETSRSGCTIIDPARGKVALSWKGISKHFTGVALELTPAAEFVRRDERQRVRLFPLIGKLPHVGKIWSQILLLALAMEVFAIVSPFFMQLVVDNAVQSGDRNLLIVLGVGFLLLALVQVGVQASRAWVTMVLGTAINLQLASGLFRKLLRLPMSFFEKRHLGDVVSRFGSVETIQRTLTTSFIEALLDGLMAGVTLIMMLIYGWKLAAIVCAAGLTYACIRLALYAPLRLANEEQILRSAKQQTNFLETVRGVQSVKLFNREAQRESLYRNMIVDTFNANIRTQKLNILFRALNGITFGIENVAVVWVGATMILDGGFSIGMMFAFMSYKQQFISRATGLVEKGIEFRMLGLHTERIADIAFAEPEPAVIDASASLVGAAELEVKNLSFRYSDNEPYVLHHVNLRIEPGESVAIVGPSGCGKTTLAKLLLGLLRPSDGDITLGGMSLNRIGTAEFRSMVGTVMQEDQLFAGSLADNITFFDERPDMERVQHCARLAAIEDDILAMPMRYNTLIGDMGTVLSGGQKQRVLLARALYKQPKLLILDEATSHLDVAREKWVNEAVSKLSLTRIIIAHRPETIASADRVIVLENGVVRNATTRKSVTTEPAHTQSKEIPASDDRPRETGTASAVEVKAEPIPIRHRRSTTRIAAFA